MKTIAVYLILFSLIFSFSDCKKKEKSPLIPDNALDPDMVRNPASAEGKKTDVNLPEFSFAKETHDFGTITEGEKVAYSFSFVNSGNADLVVSNAQASCGCTVPEYPKEPIAPGTSGVINVIFDSKGKDGYQRKEIFVYANTIPNSHKLIITGTVSKKKN
jgi:hypothetical protein